MENNFQGLLEYGKDGKITGAMSPVLFAKEMAQAMDFTFTGLIRYSHGQNYDHLLFRCKYNNVTVYNMIIDCGYGIPVGIGFINHMDGKPDTVTITPVYRKNITPQAMKDHYLNCELHPKWDEAPILSLDEESLLNIFQDCEKSGEWAIANPENKTYTIAS